MTKQKSGGQRAFFEALMTNVIVPGFMIAIWYIFNVTTVVLNKYLYVKFEFNYPFSLTAVHMLVCWIGSHLVLRTFPSQRFVFKPIPSAVYKSVVLISIIFCVNIILGNFSLSYVPVSFMQTVKSSVPAVNVILQVAIFKKTFDRKTYATVALVVLGVGASTVTETNFHLFGFLCAAIASFTTALQAIVMDKLLSGENKLDSMNSVYYMAPLSLLLLVPFVLLFELSDILTAWKYNSDIFSYFTLFVSGGIAFGLNITSFLVVKYTSALTYNVAGNFKVVLSIVVSVAIFKNQIKTINAVGCGIAILGTFFYNYVRTQQNMVHAVQQLPEVVLEK